MLFTDSSGPFMGNLMGSRLSDISQKDVTNPDTIKARYIYATQCYM